MPGDMLEPHRDTPKGMAELATLPEAALMPGDLTIREAVRRTVLDLGPDADLDDVLPHVQTKFGLSPPRATVQTYLYLARRDARDGVLNEPRRRGRPRKAPGNGHPSPVPAPAVEEVVETLELLRELCDRLGDDNVRRLLDAL